MKVNFAQFLTSSPSLEACPSTPLPEFAVIGRSNVGKSSFINLLMNRRDLAHVSAKPGHTRLINFYTIDRRWHLVDLPGYGFARTAGSERDKFTEMISEYLTGRQNLRGTFVLIDSSVPPQQIDLDFVRWLISEGIPFVLVFTKTDKISGERVQANVQAFNEALKDFCHNEPMTFLSSSREKKGHVEVLRFIHQVIVKQRE